MARQENTNASGVEQRVQELLDRLTLHEKVSLLSGKDAWQTVPIERLGVPSLVMTDGPHGVRASLLDEERVHGPATSFPTGVSMASSWNTGLIHRVGVALAEETRAMGCDILLGPCINIVRTPLAGRNFESYAEDPYLAGRIAVSFVKGVQGQNVGTSVKHYACNNQEYERFRGSSEVDERTLREIYLPAFEAAVKEGQPWTVMCSYNRINGVYASQNDYLLNEILRDEWGFDGVVVSDWGANHTITESVIGGLDIEMPGPARYYGSLLVQAVHNWQIDEAAIDSAARRILRMLVRSGKLDDPASLPPGSVNTPEHQALARELAEESIVLLKNERNVLPISLNQVRSIAVIGPNAAEARIGGGGSSYLEPPYRVSPLQGLQARLGQDVQIVYEQGCDNWAQVPALKSEYLTPARGDGHGLWGEYYGDIELSGQVEATRVDSKLDFWRIRPPSALSGSQFSVRWTGHLTVPNTGRHIFELVNTGICRLYLDGSLVVETRPDPQAPPEWPVSTETAYVELIGGREHDLRVEYVKPQDVDRAVLHVRSAFAPDPDERLARAVELARTSDIAVVFAGMAQGFESEGADRPHMKLPGAQDELIRTVARANKNTIVVLNCGAPVEMPWIDDVPAAVLAFYPGQEGGTAIARILLGEIDPSGRLSVTYPRRYEDNPTFINYPGSRQVHYGEGIFVGYRYYDQKDIAPLFPFGFGLSYTRFAYSDLRVPATAKVGEPIEVSVVVTNTGQRAGKEVVQLYVHDQASSLVRPPKELKGFDKVFLEPGESTVVRLALDRRAFSFYDPDQGAWIMEPGTFDILVGSSSRSIQATASIALV